MSVLREYMFDFWHRNTYKRSDIFPLVSGSPVQSFAFLFATYAVLKVVSFIRNAKYELRPLILIFNGFMFGVYTVGLLIVVFWLANGGRLFIDCSPPPAELKNAREFFTDYCIYLFFVLKLMDIIAKMTFASFDKSSKSLTPIIVARMLLDILHSYVILKFYPGGISIFTAATDVVVSTVDFGHQTLVSASPELRPLLKRGTLLLSLRSIQHLICFAHGIYFLSQPTCMASQSYVLFFQAFYNTISFIYYSTPLTFKGLV